MWRTRSTRSAVVAGAALAVWLSAAAPARSCPKEEEVQVTVVAILATGKDKKVDPKLAEVAKAIQKKRPYLTGFATGQTTCAAIPVGKEKKFKLVEDQCAVVTVTHGADARDRVGLRVKAPKLGEVEYTCCCGKYFPLVTEYYTKDGKLLIIAVMIRPCKGK